MPIKSILTWVDHSEHAKARLDMAVAAAKRFDAHLSVASICFLPEIPVDIDSMAYAMPDFEAMREGARKEADSLARDAAAKIQAEAMRGDAFPLTTTAAGFAREIGQKARYVDLVVLARPDLANQESIARQVFEGALFDGAAAVLVSTADANLKPERVMIAWDGGPSVMRAVRRAHPFLEAAREIEIVLVEATAPQAKSGEDFAMMLSRYGLSGTITRVPADGRTDAEALKQHQVESGAEFVVMGAFGHSPFRETILGGVTRDFPGLAGCPVLLAH